MRQCPPNGRFEGRAKSALIRLAYAPRKQIGTLLAIARPQRFRSLQSSGELEIQEVPVVRIFKSAAVVLIAGLVIGTAWLGERQTLASVKSTDPFYVTNVHVGPPRSQWATRDARRQWIGKKMTQVVARLGQPSQAYQLNDTGGEMLIYLRPYHEHYVFELDPGAVAANTVGGGVR
jgi:hypothetical protein